MSGQVRGEEPARFLEKSLRETPLVHSLLHEGQRSQVAHEELAAYDDNAQGAAYVAPFLLLAVPTIAAAKDVQDSAMQSVYSTDIVFDVVETFGASAKPCLAAALKSNAERRATKAEIARITKLYESALSVLSV